MKLERVKKVVSLLPSVFRDGDLFCVLPPDDKYPDNILFQFFSDSGSNLSMIGTSERYLGTIKDEYQALVFLNEWNKHMCSTAYLLKDDNANSFTAGIHNEIIMADKLDDSALTDAVFTCIGQFRMFFQSLYNNRIIDSPTAL